MYFLLFPGQGSQKPGMASDLVAAFPAAADIVARADAALGFPLGALCADGPAELKRNIIIHKINKKYIRLEI